MKLFNACLPLGCGHYGAMSVLFTFVFAASGTYTMAAPTYFWNEQLVKVTLQGLYKSLTKNVLRGLLTYTFWIWSCSAENR